MTSEEEVQRLYYATLTGNSEIMAFVNNVYDDVPRDPFGAKDAYISFGASDTNPVHADGLLISEITTQIDIWTRSPGAKDCRILTALVRDALTDESLSLNEHALADTHVFLTRVLPKDSEGVAHGVVQVTATVEEQ